MYTKCAAVIKSHVCIVKSQQKVKCLYTLLIKSIYLVEKTFLLSIISKQYLYKIDILISGYSAPVERLFFINQNIHPCSKS